MSSTARPSAPPQDGGAEEPEMDSVKESISDIINQLQDIDPARLSFSPFLDLDTQISLAPVSDSPESSVEELHSAGGSQRSLAPGAPAQPDRAGPDDDSRPDESGSNEPEQGVPEGRDLSSPIATTAHSLEDAVENRDVAPDPLPPSSPSTPSTPSSPTAERPNGTDRARWVHTPSPRAQNHPQPQHHPADEGRPLLDGPPETVELAVWMDSEGRGQECDAGDMATDAQTTPRTGRCCCCGSGRVPALGATLASLVCTVGILYALYFYVPVKAPHCPDLASRLVFTMGCCLVAVLPVLLVMLSGWVCHFCSGSLEPVEPVSRRWALQRLFVSSSLELLLLYMLNLLLMASQLPQKDLHLVPMAAAMFFLGRLIYWASLHMCSTWRAFGSGLTTFPLLAMVALNLFLLYNLCLEYPVFRSHDLILNRDTPSLWSSEAMGGETNATLDTM